MSKLVRLAALALVLCLALAACGDIKGEGSGESSVLSAEPSEDMSGTEVAPPYKLMLEQQAEKLLKLDFKVIDIFANLSLAPYAQGMPKADYGYKISDEYYPLSKDCEYSRYDNLVALLDLAYTPDSGLKDKLLTQWPPVGNSVFRWDYRGNTEMCCVYKADFDTRFDGVVSYLGEEDGGRLAFQYNGSSIYKFYIKNTDLGYRLTDSVLFAEEYKGTAHAAEDAGSAVDLAGDCLWLNVFADDTVSTWNGADKAAVTAMVTEARDYMLDCAAPYGVDLSMELVWADIGFNKKLPIASGNADWALQAFDGTGWKDTADYVQSVLKDKKWDNLYITFHFNYYGRSFCVPCTDKDSKKGDRDYYEAGVAFYGHKEEGAFYACPSVYLHELLHAYGAKDLYKETLSQKGEDVAKLLFPQDIMRVEPANIEACTVDVFTAKLIGWTEFFPKQLRDLLKECR